MLQQLKGVGEKTLASFHSAGIQTLYDLMHTYPKRYRTYVLQDPNHPSSEKGYYEARVLARASIYQVRPKLKRLSVPVHVGGREHQLVFFNQTHWLKHLQPGVSIVFEAHVNQDVKAIQTHTIMLRKNFPDGIVPEYGIEGLSEGKIRQCLTQARTIGGMYAQDPLPEWILKKRHIMPYHRFIRKVHHPLDADDIEAVWARLSYEELLRKQIKALLAKHALQTAKNRHTLIHERTLQPFIAQLPFHLTGAQKEVLLSLVDGLNQPTTLYHLLQGDTGSGKTVLAFMLAYLVLERGEQVALLAPTEALAQQHYKVAMQWLAPLGYEPALVLGGLNTAQRTIIEEAMNQKTTLFIGTHALFSQRSLYKQLGFVMVDEQHRFGVNQRLAMAQKGEKVDVLYLSATPIPRTLALTLYGDMDLVTLRQKPAQRQPIETMLFPLKKAKELDATIESTLSRNEQIYLIAPRIDEDPGLLSIDRIESYYTQRFPNARIGVLHGQLSRPLKEVMLTSFSQHELDILISTSVVEVGIDVKTATLMLIFHGERFGLAQLHQLRGRLARGSLPGTCYILYKGSKDTRTRLSILETTDDGFLLSERDLEQRGFGDLLGEAQSGMMPYRFTSEADLIAQLEAVKEDAEAILSDPITYEKTIQHVLSLEEDS